MGDRLRFDLVPGGAIRGLALGWLNAWTYDYGDPGNFLRDTCVQIRNNCDRILGEYMKQLGDSLAELRRGIPRPTRENPFPPAGLLDEVKALERYMRQVEDLRTRVIGAAMPSMEILRRDRRANLDVLHRIQEIDKEMIDRLSTMDDSKIDMLNKLLDERNVLIRDLGPAAGPGRS